ncbi:hypothetical protein ACFW03_27535, partial [Peribacillus butanolivorans]|uniref:hypothetical protein n=1 Tax=Peribacillus butanolivorans TaxID=421767 RepID=UPI003675724D
RQKCLFLIVKTKLIGTEGARLLREKRVQGRPYRRKGAEEAPGPPAESECPTFQSTFEFVQPLKKTVDSRMAVLRTQVFTHLLKQCENFIESKNTAYKNISFEIYFKGPFNFS